MSMADYVLMTDSCCDLTAEMAEELGLVVLPLRLEMKGREYRNWLDGREIGFQDFYNQVRSGEMPVTSAVNVGQFEEAMRPVLEAGKDILCLCFSSALSTTFQSAGIAAKELAESLPERNVHVLDHMEKTACLTAEQTVFISHGDCLEDAEFVAEEIRRRLGVRNIYINYVGPVIGSHTGAGVVALFFTGGPR